MELDGTVLANCQSSTCLVAGEARALLVCLLVEVAWGGAHLSIGLIAVEVAPDALQRVGLDGCPGHNGVVCGSATARQRATVTAAAVSNLCVRNSWGADGAVVPLC